MTRDIPLEGRVSALSGRINKLRLLRFNFSESPIFGAYSKAARVIYYGWHREREREREVRTKGRCARSSSQQGTVRTAELSTIARNIIQRIKRARVRDQIDQARVRTPYFPASFRPGLAPRSYNVRLMRNRNRDFALATFSSPRNSLCFTQVIAILGFFMTSSAIEYSYTGKPV